MESAWWELGVRHVHMRLYPTVVCRVALSDVAERRFSTSEHLFKKVIEVKS